MATLTGVMIVLGLVWIAWGVQALLSAWQWRIFAGKYTHNQHSGKSPGFPKAVIIVPFKGIDLDLHKAIQGLCTLDYPNYELLLIVDSKDDPAYPILQQEVANYPHIPSQVLVAGPAGMHEGQKVHNQLHAIDHLMAQRQNAPIEACPRAWVFADSDAIPGPHWLTDLIRPLFSPTVGMTTGYRWLVPTAPEKGQHASIFWSSIASVINSSVIGFLGKARFNHAWGGSMALWADTAIQGDLRGHLDGALCDDYQFSKMVRKLGKRIYFVRSCLVASPVAFSFKSLLNFSHRQYLLTRVYAPKLYLAALTLVGFYLFAQVTAFIAMIILLITHPTKWWLWGTPLLIMLTVFIWNQLRATQRSISATRALGPENTARLKTTMFIDRWMTCLWMSVHLVLILQAVCGRTMLWRGIYYRLHAPQRVERINRS